MARLTALVIPKDNRSTRANVIHMQNKTTATTPHLRGTCSALENCQPDKPLFACPP
jgi:hypothetical protein